MCLSGSWVKLTDSCLSGLITKQPRVMVRMRCGFSTLFFRFGRLLVCKGDVRGVLSNMLKAPSVSRLLIFVREVVLEVERSKVWFFGLLYRI